MAGTWTYDPAHMDSAVNALRLQLADTDFSNVGDTVPRGQQTALFSDQEYQSLLALAGGDVTLALVKALYTIANNRAIMAIAVNLGGGGSVDFGKLAAEIRAQAQEVKTLWEEIPAEAIAEIDYGPFSAGRVLWNQLLRTAV